MADKRLYHNIADQISELIDSGVFPPGSRLPGERELAERFEVSRVTIREAEISLQAIGKIEIKTGSGVYVCEQVPAGHIDLANVSAFELTEARALYESESAAIAAPIIQDADIAELDRLLDEMSKDGVSQEVAEQADRDFHLKIARATGNAAIVFVVESLWKMRTELPEVKRVYDSICSEDTSDRGDEHRDVVNALKARNPLAARQAMRQHFNRILESMLVVTEREAVEAARRQASESRERYLISAKIG